MTPGEEIRLRLVLHYDGSRFHGWQIQPELRTVQGVLHAVARHLTGAERTITGSGRTDRGVHATGQVASLVVPSSWSADTFRRAMNANLPGDVWVAEAQEVEPDFHPRYDAVARTYRYRLGLSREAWSPFVRPWCWPLEKAPDLSVLDATAAQIPGDRSFAAFAKSGQPERGTRCRVDWAEWEPWEEHGVQLVITADRFLHHMVRYLVGTMVAMAWGRRRPEELEDLLEGGPTDELWTSAPAPASGLFLHRVEYPEGTARSPHRAPRAWTSRSELFP